MAFFSFASNLVSGDTNNRGDVFIRDRQTGVTERVSLTASDGQATGSESGHASISDDGRYVAFASEAGNLVPGDTNGTQDVFVRDRQAGTTERVSVDSSGGQVDNGNDTQPVISGDGRFVAFHSVAADLVPGDTNNSLDVFVHDRQTGLTERSSVDSNGAQANRASTFPSISANGRFVAFGSAATNLGADLNDILDIYLHDRGGTAGTLAYSLKPASGTNFGEQPINTTSSRRPFTVTNTGTAPLPMIRIAVTGFNKGLFPFTHNCPASIAVGAKCTILVRFAPKSLGLKKAVLQVVAGENQTRKRQLAGTGVAPP